MQQEHIGDSENMLLQRGIFSMTDFTAFQKSEVVKYRSMLFTRNTNIYNSSCRFVFSRFWENPYPLKKHTHQ